MEVLAVPLAVVVVTTMVVVWVREQRTWKPFHEAAIRQQDTATRLHGALSQAGIRSRYKLVGGLVPHGAGGHNPGMVRTARVLVHRDDLHRAEQVLADLRREGNWP